MSNHKVGDKIKWTDENKPIDPKPIFREIMIIGGNAESQKAVDKAKDESIAICRAMFVFKNKTGREIEKIERRFEDIIIHIFD